MPLVKTCLFMILIPKASSFMMSLVKTCPFMIPLVNIRAFMIPLVKSCIYIKYHKDSSHDYVT
jgi:uncharacterized protein involved in cysteine biosynthesis